MMNLGDFTTSETIYVPLTTYDSNGGSVTLTGLATTDIEIYKDGSTTQRSSDAGYALLDTDGIDFDLTTGLHGFSIDLSDNTDAGFYANGSQYWLVVNSVTVDSQTVVVCYYFTIGRYLKPTTSGRTLDVTTGGAAGIDWGNIENKTTANDLSGTDIQLCDTVTTNTDMRGTDNAALASVLGALADAAADGDPTSADTVMQYLKQLVNVMVGSTGITTFPAEAAPANNVSLAEVVRAIHADVTGLNGDAMRGTDGANTTTPPTAAQNADAVWDEARSGHTTPGTYGEHTGDAAMRGTDSANTTTPPTAAAIVNEWESQSQADPTGFHVNLLEINSDSNAAQQLARSAGTIVNAAAAAGTLSTTQMTTTLTEGTDDHFNGRILIWTSGALQNQATDITDYDGTSKLLTFTAVTEAPSASDTFIIV